MTPDDLREAWLDGSLDEAGCAELDRLVAADPALARSLAESQRGDLLLRLAHGRSRDLAPGVMAGLRGQASRANLKRAVMRSVRRRPVRRARWPWALAAAAVLVLAVLLVPRGAPPVGRILAVAGQVEVLRGSARFTAAADTLLQVGDALRTAQDGQVRFAARAAAMDLGPATVLEILPDTLRLSQGTLAAEVEPQPPEAPLVFTTPGARATVLGTVLALRIDGDLTRLDVQRGRVRLQGDADAGVEITAGTWGQVRSGAAPVAWQPLFPDGLAGWQPERGSWVAIDGLIRGGPSPGRTRLASVRAYGDLELACSIRVTGTDFAEVQLNDYSWFAEIPSGGWKQVRIRQRGAERTCEVDGRPVAFQSGRPAGPLASGPLAFYVRAGGTVEIREGSLSLPP